jgi:hypothetical protein
MNRKFPCTNLILEGQIPVTQNLPQVNIIKKKYECGDCLKIFARADTLKKHIDSYCKVKKDKIIQDKNIHDEQIKNNHILEEILEEMNQLKKQNKELVEKITNIEAKNAYAPNIPNITIGSNNNNNINNNNIQNINNTSINLVPFGSENYSSFITDETCKKILGRGLSSIEILAKHAHFNSEFPQYHNCYISNMRDNHALIYGGDKWCLANADDTIQALTEKESAFLEEKFDELKDTLTPNTITQFNRYLDKKNTDAEVLAKRYKDELKMICYNNRELVIKTKKAIEKNKTNELLQVSNNTKQINK